MVDVHTLTPSFDYDPSLEEYAVSQADFLRKHTQYDIICTGVVVFNEHGELLLIQRAKSEKAFPDCWEIPGGKVDAPDLTILHGAGRELREEAGITATRFVRKVHEFVFVDAPAGRVTTRWLKLIFEVEVADSATIKLDPVEHQDHLFVTEEDLSRDRSGEHELKYISLENKLVKLEAFRLRKGAHT